MKVKAVLPAYEQIMKLLEQLGGGEHWTVGVAANASSLTSRAGPRQPVSPPGIKESSSVPKSPSGPGITPARPTVEWASSWDAIAPVVAWSPDRATTHARQFRYQRRCDLICSVPPLHVTARSLALVFFAPLFRLRWAISHSLPSIVKEKLPPNWFPRRYRQPPRRSLRGRAASGSPDRSPHSKP